MIRPNELMNFPEFKIVIAIEKEQVANEIIKELKALGIAENRLVWRDYGRDKA